MDSSKYSNKIKKQTKSNESNKQPQAQTMIVAQQRAVNIKWPAPQIYNKHGSNDQIIWVRWAVPGCNAQVIKTMLRAGATDSKLIIFLEIDDPNITENFRKNQSFWKI